MPLHDVGYRKWEGQSTSQLSRFQIITSTGIRLASQSRWVRRMLFFAWLPVMYWGVGFFVIERALESNSNVVTETMEAAHLPPLAIAVAKQRTRQINDPARISRLLRNQFRMIPQVEMLATTIEAGDKTQTRNIVWRWLLMTFFRYPQALLILFLIGSIAPPLISRDIRSRAFLLYFSRPIGKLEYIFGKLCVPMAFIVFVTTLPALALYLFAILMSPDLSVFLATWDIPIRILLATVALVIPTASLALMLSSLTQESRFANFAWFAIWALGHGAWVAVLFATSIQVGQPPVHATVMESAAVKNWSVLSLYNNLGDVQAWIFGFVALEDVWKGVAMLGAVSLISLIVLYRRVAAPIRV
jgi:ABC-2 type transport system permease protein